MPASRILVAGSRIFYFRTFWGWFTDETRGGGPLARPAKLSHYR
jgi:hypothetical protein